MIKNKVKCYLHPKVKATNICDRCNKPICDKCSNVYWKTNGISAMFSPQKEQNVKLILCPHCLKIEKIKSVTLTSFFLILIVGVIVTGILYYVAK